MESIYSDLDRIINEINSHSDWSLNVKIRYAYLELGKLVHKDLMWFYTVQNNLLAPANNDIKYDIDKVSEIMNTENYFDYSVICRTSAEMLDYIFNSCGIESEIRHTKESSKYFDNGKTVDIIHYFICVTGDEGKKYFLTLNPDLPNIQLGRSTSHFGSNINYIEQREIKDADGKLISVEDVQMYEGEKIDNSVMSPEEIASIDLFLGYRDNIVYGEDEPVYNDYFINMIRESSKNNDNYLDYISEETSFFRDICLILNDGIDIEEVLALPEYDYTSEPDFCLDVKLDSISDKQIFDLKELILISILNKFYTLWNVDLPQEKVYEYVDFINNEDYQKVFEMFREDFKPIMSNPENKSTVKLNNPMFVIKCCNDLMQHLDKLRNYANMDSKERIKYNKEFCAKLHFVSKNFIPDEYYPRDYNRLKSSYISHKIVHTFKRIFDIGAKTKFNDLGVAEQVMFIKEILNITLREIKMDETVPNFKEERTPIANRIYSTVIVDKETGEMNYLICVKATSNDIDYGCSPILFGLKSNTLTTNVKMSEIIDKYYLVRDASLELGIENIERVSSKKSF